MADRTDKISQTGSISLGTGLMIGAGIFALMGQLSGVAAVRDAAGYAARPLCTRTRKE